jgi:hypothetical protein
MTKFVYKTKQDSFSQYHYDYNLLRRRAFTKYLRRAICTKKVSLLWTVSVTARSLFFVEPGISFLLRNIARLLDVWHKK